MRVSTGVKRACFSRHLSQVTDGKESGGAQAKSTLNTAVDLSVMMLAEIKMRYDDVRCWHGDVVDLAASSAHGEYDVALFNAMFGNVHSQRDTLRAAVDLLKPANLPPEELVEELTGVDRGVYFGWAQLAPDGDKSESESKSKGASGEVHILHKYDEDFYGKEVRVVVLGAIRREMKFASLDELVRRIHADIKIAETELARDEELAGFRRDPFFLPPAPATPRGGGDA
eukprot:jgi/Mesen1/5432/ME000027S04799